jgi:hypothetical protein
MKRFFLNNSKKPEAIVSKPELPYVIDVINDSDEIRDAEIFGSAEYIPKVNKDGILEKDGVRIANGVHNSSYLALLSAVWKQAIRVDFIYITLIEGDKKQLDEKLTHIYSHPNGIRTEQVILAYKDPYQMQDNIIVTKEAVTIDFLTKLCFQIMPKTHVRIQFFHSKAD